MWPHREMTACEETIKKKKNACSLKVWSQMGVAAGERDPMYGDHCIMMGSFHQNEMRNYLNPSLHRHKECAYINVEWILDLGLL